jgi:hypothetical protein
MIKYLLIPLLLFSLQVTSQKISGTVFTDKGDLLPYSSITIKGVAIGTSANNKAKFLFHLPQGTYTLICQHIGYAKQEKQIVIDKMDVEISFILSEQKLNLNEVVVKSGGEDPAYEIIRQAIKKRDFYNKQVQGFECGLYTKDIIKLRNLPNKIFGQKIPEEDRKDMGLDSSGKGIIYLSESIAKVFAKQPDKFKMEVSSSRVSGSDGFGFTFPTFISLYNNNVTIFTERFNPRGFISPIADGAIRFYKFKYLGSFWEDGKEINSIQIIPRRNYEPLFSGKINITDGDWRIHSFDLMLTKKAQLELLDTLQISQMHIPVNDEVWRVKNQVLYFNFKQFKIDAIGNFVNVYSNYNVHPVFPKKFFDKIIIKYDTAVNKKTTAYWDSVRPMPLELEEKKDYAVKDSIYQLQRDSVLSQKSIDSLNNRQGKLKPLHIFWQGIDRKKYKKDVTISWGVNSLIKNVEYNTVEGLVVNFNSFYNQFFNKRKHNISIQPHIRYGFSNTHLNAWADVVFRTRDWSAGKKIKRESWIFSGGKRVSQFNKENPISALSNSITTLFWGDNFMKIYENYFGSIGFSKRYESGVRVNLSALYEDRVPVDNTTDFVLTRNKSNSFTPNYPSEKIVSQFTPHQVFLLHLSISIKPGQRYIQLPYNKIPIGSKYPTFSVNYIKGIENVLGSDADFDKWKLVINDDKNFKLAGQLKYRIGIGGFINTKKVFIQDYQHFNGNRSTSASEYVNSFQLANYYANSTIASFYTFGHVEHHFNGLLTNKIPFFNRLNWTLVGGSNTFYINKNSNYIEVFAGIENILKILRVDFVAAYTNGEKASVGIRIGAGGTIGGNIKTNSQSQTVSINF